MCVPSLNHSFFQEAAEVVIFSVILAILVIYIIYLLWKNRSLRRLLKEQEEADSNVCSVTHLIGKFTVQHFSLVSVFEK